MISIVYFSPTGNTKHLAEKLAESLQEETQLFPLEFTNPNDIPKCNHIVLIHAIHAFNAPRTVHRFIKEFPADKAQHITILSVGCNDLWINKAASNPIGKKLKKLGYEILGNRVLAMPVNLVAPFPKKLAQATIRKAEAQLVDIAQAIETETPSTAKAPLSAKLLQTIGRGESFAARIFGLELHANKKCTQCDLCIERCPEKNIRYNKKKHPSFGFNCLMCLRCIYECPEKAITPRISKFIPIKGGYTLQKNLEEE